MEPNKPLTPQPFYQFNETEKKLLNKKNLLGLLVIGILVLVIPFGVKLVREQTALRSKASTDAVKFVTGESTGIECDSNGGNCRTTSETVELELTSPLGEPGSDNSGQNPTATPTIAAPSPTATVTPAQSTATPTTAPTATATPTTVPPTPTPSPTPI